MVGCHRLVAGGGRWSTTDCTTVDQGMFPSSVTRTQLLPGSRRASIASRRSGSWGPRPSGTFARASSSQADANDLHSPSSGVFLVDSDDDAPGPSVRHAHRNSETLQAGQMPYPRRRESRRKSRATSPAQSMGYVGYKPDHSLGHDTRDNPDDATFPFSSSAASPTRPSTTLGKIASYIGFNRQEADEAAGLVGHRPSISRSRSRDGSFASSRGSGGPRSPSVSTSEESWGYGDEDDDYSDEPDDEEGYNSSIADDTSLPPQSRPPSPHIPLIPNSTDAVFGGEPSRGPDDEPKDFASDAVPSRQTILLPDEDLSIRFTGYRTDPFRNTLWWAGCICTFGGLGLLGRWVPSTWVNFCGKETAFDEATEGSWLVVEVRH